MKKWWQGIFLLGVVVCTVTTAVVLGGTGLATIVAVGSLVVSILNGLLSPNGIQGNDTWFLATLKRSLNVGGFLKTATVAIWLCIFGLGGFAGIRAYESRQFISIDGLVETATGEPADNALVTLLESGEK
jgi:hypothetical protein